jgi:hypothetical protein
MKRAIWLWVLGALLVAGYAVPYTLLAGVGRWSGAFLFWLLFGVLVWAILSVTVMRWRIHAKDADGPADQHEAQS